MADIANSNLLDKGIPSNPDAFIVLIKTEWNTAIVDELEAGCIRVLKEYQVGRIKTITVPGCFEIPFAVRNSWTKGQRPDAFIALGCVIRGGTPHFEYVCQAVTDGVLRLNLMLPVPTIFGVLTVDHEEQARERIGGIHGHKGEEAAITALKMIQLKPSES